MQVSGEVIWVPLGWPLGSGLDGPQQAKEQQQATCTAAEEADGPEQGSGGLRCRVSSGWGWLAGLGTCILFTPPSETECPSHENHHAADCHAVAKRGGHTAPVTGLDMEKERRE